LWRAWYDHGCEPQIRLTPATADHEHVHDHVNVHVDVVLIVDVVGLSHGRQGGSKLP
jgi:hypothetical protein